MIQSMLYTIGNKPIFPSSFNYKEYYYYLEFEENNKVYIVVRRGDSYIVSCAGDIRFFEDTAEFLEQQCVFVASNICEWQQENC